ncbi:MAG: hypothetical protein K2J71_04800, partial [Oscillospiraceae bacterium]|nr:hypothetical protein [Oscillospiraceae bacterium]
MKNEKVEMTIDISNPHVYAVENLEVNIKLPSNFTIESSDMPEELPRLSAGETVIYHATAKCNADTSLYELSTVEQKYNPIVENQNTSTIEKRTSSIDGSPVTGDNDVIVIACILGLSLLLAVKSGRFNKKTMCVVLCLLLSSNMLPICTNAMDITLETLETQISQDTITLTTSIKFGKNNCSINADVRFSYQIQDAINEFEIDTDEDGIPDIFEKQMGFDPNSKDTDGDGLLDLFEYSSGILSVTLTDTDGNGINDFDEDSDFDGLTNGKEQELGTNPCSSDSDGDTLTDSEEISGQNIYITNPMKIDTDDDGLTDDVELLFGTDPTNPRTDGQTLDSERRFWQSTSKNSMDEGLLESKNWLLPSVSGEVTGLLDNQISLKKDETLSFAENRSVVSDVVEINTTCTEPLRVSFQYDDDYADNLQGLTVVCYQDENLVPIDVKVDTTYRTISGDYIGDGYYFVMNVEGFLKSIGIDTMESISYPELSEKIIKKPDEEATETSEDIIEESAEEATETSEDIIKESAEEATETSGDIIEESTEEATETSEDIIKESTEEATETSEDIIKES